MAEAHPSCRRTIFKVVPVDVTIEKADLIHTLTDEDLRVECEARGISLRRVGSKGKALDYVIALEELDDIRVLLQRGRVDDALAVLEWALPKDLRGLAAQVGQFFADRATLFLAGARR